MWSDNKILAYVNNLCITCGKNFLISLIKEQGMDISGGNNDCAGVVPVGSFKREPEKQ